MEGGAYCWPAEGEPVYGLGTATTLEMSDGEKWQASKRRRPIGFAPADQPSTPRAGKPRIRPKGSAAAIRTL